MVATKKMQTLPELKVALLNAMQSVAQFSQEVSEEQFFTPFGEKWSIAENLEHLILSNGATMKTLSYPIEKLNAKFGEPKRTSISGVELETKYMTAIGAGRAKSTPPFNPNQLGEKSKKGLLEMWSNVDLGMQKELQNWSDEDLEKAQIPHPILGFFTIREFLHFTIFHTKHHLKAMQKIAANKID